MASLMESKGQFTITIPKEVVEATGWKKGDKLYIGKKEEKKYFIYRKNRTRKKMNIQNLVSLEISNLREKAIDLTSEFESKNKLGRKNYNKRLDRFLKIKIGKSVNRILVTQILLSVSSLKMSNQNI